MKRESFLLVKLECPYCLRWRFAKVCLRLPLKIVRYVDGNPESNYMERMLGEITSEKLPIGVVGDHVIASSFGTSFMYHFLKRLKEEGVI